MKKSLSAVLLCATLFIAQAVSAATLELQALSGGTVNVDQGSTVSGTGTGEAAKIFGISLPFSVSTWKVKLDQASDVTFTLGGGLAFSYSLFSDDLFTPPPVFQANSVPFTTNLNAGEYWLSIFSGFGNVGVSYDLTITAGNIVGNVPVPAAAWLFGSALIGLIGVARRNA